jgi:hypothetical protein
MKTTGIALAAAVLAIAACGGSDAPTAASCADSWNSDTNAKQQATLAGVAAVDVLVGDKYRVGTWPKSEQKVNVTEGFGEGKGREAVVSKNSCIVLLPDSRMGQMVFVEAGDKWGFIARQKSAFPNAALKAIAGARFAEPDVLGKLKLEGGGAE